MPLANAEVARIPHANPKVRSMKEMAAAANADIRIAEKQGGYGARQMRLSERDQRPNLLRLRLGRLEPGAGHGRADRAANGRGDGVGVADLHL